MLAISRCGRGTLTSFRASRTMGWWISRSAFYRFHLGVLDLMMVGWNVSCSVMYTYLSMAAEITEAAKLPIVRQRRESVPPPPREIRNGLRVIIIGFERKKLRYQALERTATRALFRLPGRQPAATQRIRPALGCDDLVRRAHPKCLYLWGINLT